MKNIYVKFGTLLLLSLSSFAFAFTGLDIEASPSGKRYFENHVVGKMFCEEDSGKTSGLFVLPSFKVNLIDSTAGMPDPFSFYRINHLEMSGAYFERVQKSTGAVIELVGTITHADSFGAEDERLTLRWNQVLYPGKEDSVYSPSNCKP